jgi:N-acetylglucosaminyl-diphospho-decaprenol L-rhamnosyltransferase
MSMNAVELSICIVNWNNRDLLRELLNSLRVAYVRLAAEVIIVDNASTDGSAEMVATEFPDVYLIRNGQNLGFSKANNLAVANAQGRFILFLNNDTIVRPDALEMMLQLLDERPDVVAVGPRLTNIHGRPRDRYTRLPTLPALLHRIRLLHWTCLFRKTYRDFRRGRFNAAESQPVEQVPGSAMMVRREQFLASGGWDEGFDFGCEDFDLSARLKRVGVLYYLASAEVVHLGGRSSRANTSFVYRGYECGCARYLAKHSRWRAAPWIYKTFVTVDMPIRILTLAGRYALIRIRKKHERADRELLHLTAASEFLFFNLARFWRS